MTAEPTDRHNAPTHTQEVDQSIANLLEQMARELEERGAVDLEALARSHPEHAERLRQLLPAMEAVAGWAERTASLSPAPRAPADVPQIGDSLQYFGDYELLEEIARGGMGVVYKARQTTLNRVVALKMILTGELASEREVERFHAEAQAAARLDHPGIVPIFEVGQHNGRHYFSMGYVEGTSLADRVNQGPLDPREAADLIRKVTQAVAYAHNEGVVHRDLKPANVLLDARNEPRVTDFGLAKQVRGGSDLTATGQVLGTPAYMPPEQAGGAVERVDERSDVYSMGAMLYCVLTGRPPFQAASPVDTLLQVLSTEAVAPRTLNPAVPADLETICLKCLEKDPRRRYQSANEVGEELERFLNHLPIQARPVRRVERAWRWCKRNRTVAALTVAIASLLFGIAVAGPLVAWRQSELRSKAEEASQQEREQREKAEQLVEANRRQLVNMNVLQGDQRLERNDPVSAMPWYTEALRLDQGDPKREAAHRLRLGALWNRVPKFTYLWRHEAAVNNLAISHDEQLVATASDDHTARVWNLTTGESVTPPLKHEGSVLRCGFSPDAKQLLTACGTLGLSGEINVWDIATGKKVGEPIREGMRMIFQAGFTGAGDILSGEGAMTGEGGTILRDAVTHQVKFKTSYDPPFDSDFLGFQPWHLKSNRLLGKAGNVGHVADLAKGGRTICDLKQDDVVLTATFSNDGSRVMTTTWNKFYVWDAANGKQLAKYAANINGWYGDAIAKAAARFSRDNKRITLAGPYSKVMTFDITTGKTADENTIPDAYLAKSCISDDGRFVAVSARGGGVRIWDVREGKQHVPPLKHTSAMTEAIFADNDRYVIIACTDGTVRVWDLSTAISIVGMEGDNNEITRIDLRDQLVMTYGRTTVHRRDWKAKKRLPDFEVPGPWPNAYTQSTEHGLYAAANDGVARVWNFETGKPVSPELKHDKKSFVDIGISPDGKRVATINTNSLGMPDKYFGEVSAWEIASGKRILGPFRFSDIISAIGCTEFSPDSKRLAVGGGTVSLTGMLSRLKLFDLETGREIQNPYQPTSGVGISRVQFDPKGRYLATLTRGPLRVGSSELRIWDLKEQQPVGDAIRFADEPIDLQIDSQSRFVIAAVASEVHVLHIETGRPAVAPLAHDQSINLVALSDDGRWIATSEDNKVYVWDLVTGRHVAPAFEHPSRVNAIKIAPAEVVLTAYGNTLQAWKFKPLDHPVDEIARMTQLLSGEEVSSSLGATSSAANQLQANWDSLRGKMPAEFRNTDIQKILWLSDKVTSCWNHGEWSDAVLTYEQMEKMNNVSPDNFGQALCQTGQFARAAEQFDKAVKASPGNVFIWAHAAAARLSTNDLAAYREVCGKMLRQFEKTDDPWGASRTSIICLIGPNEFKAGSAPFQLADRAAKQIKSPGEPTQFVLSKAIADYRAGQYEVAQKELGELIHHPIDWLMPPTIARYLLAMTLWRLDKTGEAREKLVEAEKYCEEHPIGDSAGTWFDRALVDVIRREAKAIIVLEKTSDETKSDKSEQKRQKP